MASNIILRGIEAWLGDVNLELYIKVPSLVVVGNLEEALRLQRKVDPKKFMIIHSPEIIKEYGQDEQKLDGKYDDVVLMALFI